MLLDDIKSYLQSQGITEPIYIGRLPDGPDDCVALFEYAGRPPYTLIAVDTPGLQVKIRGAAGDNDYQDARARAQTILNTLHDIKNVLINSTRYIHVQAQGTPGPLGRDQAERPIFNINFLVRKDRE
jgi:hypothetical protein